MQQKTKIPEQSTREGAPDGMWKAATQGATAGAPAVAIAAS